MKKLSFLVSALVLALIANAATINITPTSPHSKDNLRQALASASAGDVIVMAAGFYDESNSNYIAFDKSVVVKAANGADVTILPRVPITISNGARAEIRGIKINADSLHSKADWYEHVIYSTDANDGNKLIMDGCKLYNFKLNNSAIFCSKDYKLDSCIINNCVFDTITKSCIFMEHAGLLGLKVTNSTFANIAQGETESYYASNIFVKAATAAQVLIDHCTFYDVNTMNTDYGAVKVLTSTSPTVSNCIFMMPSSYSGGRAVYNTNGAVTNCLTYNYSKDSSPHGIHSGPSITGCIEADPLFTNAASGNFTFAGNWSTMSISPARGAATDGSDLGDPRWYTAETLPSTSFASAYDLLPTKAKLSGRIELNASDKIHFKHNSDVADGTAKWKLHVGRSCMVSAVVDVQTGETVGRQLTLTVKDADGNTVATLAQASATYNDADINLGQIVFTEAGDYTFILTNSTFNSTVVLEKITLIYAGGATVDIPTTLPLADVLLSSNALIQNDSIKFAATSSGTSSAEWAKWNIHTTGGIFTFTVNAYNPKAGTGQTYSVKVYAPDNEAAPLLNVTSPRTEALGAYSYTTSTVSLSAGDYVVKVQNSTNWSWGRVMSVVATSKGTTVTIPETLAPADAILSTRARVDNDSILFTARGDEGYNSTEWAKWRVRTTTDAVYKFTLNAYNAAPASAQRYTVTVLSEDESETLATIQSKWTNSENALTAVLSPVELAAGTYIVKVQNTEWGSKGRVLNIVAEKLTVLTIDEEAIANTVISDNYRNGEKTIRIIRTITAGMYNTICLPFDVDNIALKNVFGADVELKEMNAATIDGSVLDLSFVDATSIYRGTPYLIKTSRNVVNPVFVSEIKEKTGQATSGSRADFIGNFIAGTITASPDNLFLGANDKLYFPTGDTPIKGMRAYFHVHDAPAGVITRARIVQSGNVVTEVELIDGELRFSDNAPEATRKIIENGQVIIIRDGIRYNAIGIRLSE